MGMKGLVVTVGGSPEPVQFTLNEHKFPYVLFVVSSDTRAKVEECIIPKLSYPVPQYEYSEVHHQDFDECYRRLKSDVDGWLSRRGMNSAQICVDITGGTKVMSSVLTLIAIELGCKEITYVAGEKRGAGGLGTVETGSEFIVHAYNPWNAYAVYGLERANWLLREFHAAAAAHTLREASKNCDGSVRTRLESLAGLADAFDCADKFDFRGATSSFHRWKSRLELALDYSDYEKALSHNKRWNIIKAEVNSQGKTPRQRETLLELIANAERRANQARYDDAVGRLYRAVELYGQQLLHQAFGAELGKPSLHSFPERRQADVKERLGEPDENGQYKLGVQNLFRALEFSEDEALREKAGICTELRNPLQTRNSSILAHGLQPVTKKEFCTFWRAALSALEISDDEIPRWPQFNLKLPAAP